VDFFVRLFKKFIPSALRTKKCFRGRPNIEYRCDLHSRGILIGQKSEPERLRKRSVQYSNPGDVCSVLPVRRSRIFVHQNQSIMQTSILILFLVLTVAVIMVFTIVFLSSRKTDSSKKGLSQPLKARLWFALTLLVVLSTVSLATIPKSPYYMFADEAPSSVVHVSSRQFAFIMSSSAIDPKSPKSDPSIELPVNEVIEFRVTSLDVNHGFAIYDPSNRLIGQTQAMPGYVNSLRVKFQEPGTYNILCLEYCGMAHHGMRSSFTVK